MGTVVDLATWRIRRTGPACGSEDVATTDVRRLETAVDRLHEVLGRALERGRLPACVETEMLAIMGEVALGGLAGAAERAERLTRRVAADARRTAR